MVQFSLSSSSSFNNSYAAFVQNRESCISYNQNNATINTSNIQYQNINQFSHYCHLSSNLIDMNSFQPYHTLLTVKASHNDETRRFYLNNHFDHSQSIQFSPSPSAHGQENEVQQLDYYQILKNKIYYLFQFEPNYAFTIQYLDDESDVIPIHSLDELNSAIHCMRKTGLSQVRKRQMEYQQQQKQLLPTSISHGSRSESIPLSIICEQCYQPILRITIVDSKKRRTRHRHSSSVSKSASRKRADSNTSTHSSNSISTNSSCNSSLKLEPKKRSDRSQREKRTKRTMTTTITLNDNFIERDESHKPTMPLSVPTIGNLEPPAPP